MQAVYLEGLGETIRVIVRNVNLFIWPLDARLRYQNVFVFVCLLSDFIMSENLKQHTCTLNSVNNLGKLL